MDNYLTLIRSSISGYTKASPFNRLSSSTNVHLYVCTFVVIIATIEVLAKLGRVPIDLLYLSTLFLWWQPVAGIIGVKSSHAFRINSRCTWQHREGLAKRLQHCHPPRAQPVAAVRKRHSRRPRLPPRRGTDQHPIAIRDTPVAHTGGEM